jgi:hypothetical protein
MKHNIFSKALLIAVTAGLTLSACSPEDFDGVSEAGLPLAENAKVTASVDDETNTVTFNMEGDGIYPMWYIPVDGKEVTKNPVYSTVNPLQKIWVNSGDYKVYYRVGNRNGMSQGMGETTFHVTNTLVDFSEIVGKLSGKEWRIAATEPAHLACGPSGTDGTEWWKAGANEKAEFGVYDDRLTFGADYSYTYNPGAGGTMYVNTGCSIFPDYHQDTDYMVPVSEQHSSYQLSAEGDDLYLVMPANTCFPYIPADAAYNGELRLRVESITGSTMVLVWDDGNIAWHYILTCASEGFQGFDSNSDCNMWKNCQFTNEFFYTNPDWAQIDNPTVTEKNGAYTIELPTATAMQWQAQVKFLTDMTTNSVTKYDFSCKLVSTTDHPGVTLKLVKTGDDNSFYFAERIDLKANQEVLFYRSDMDGIDMDNITLVVDGGGNADNTKLTISNIDLQEHKCDGVEAPAEEEDKTVYNYNSASNIWKSHVDDKGDAGFTTFFFYAPGWTEIDAPDFTADKGHYTVELPTATFAQWQAQVHLITDIPGEADTPYDFSCKFLAKKDIKGVTVKITDTSSDENFFFANTYDLKAGEEYQVKVPASVLKVGAADALKLVFDFGGNPEGEKVEIYDIIFQKTAQ